MSRRVRLVPTHIDPSLDDQRRDRTDCVLQARSLLHRLTRVLGYSGTRVLGDSATRVGGCAREQQGAKGNRRGARGSERVE